MRIIYLNDHDEQTVRDLAATIARLAAVADTAMGAQLANADEERAICEARLADLLITLLNRQDKTPAQSADQVTSGNVRTLLDQVQADLGLSLETMYRLVVDFVASGRPATEFPAWLAEEVDQLDLTWYEVEVAGHDGLLTVRAADMAAAEEIVRRQGFQPVGVFEADMSGIRCPRCGGDEVYVIEVRAEHDGLAYQPRSRLSSDGFDWWWCLPEGATNYSTSEETAECARCRETGDLAHFGFGREG